MKCRQRSVLILTSVLVLFSSCDFTPEWNCVTANAPISLYETDELETESGQMKVGDHAEIIGRLKDERDATTHFHVRTEDGAHQGWFEWAGNDIAGGTRSDCW